MAHNCDPSATIDYPKRYLYDLALVKPEMNFKMSGVEGCHFVQDYGALPYNRLLRLLTPDPPCKTDEASGRIFGPLFGTAIGEAIIVSNVRIRKSDTSRKAAVAAGPAPKLQLSCALLWRAYGDFQSLQGWCGCPLKLLEDDGSTSILGGKKILGFQSFQWARPVLNTPASSTDGDVRNETEEDAMLLQMRNDGCSWEDIYAALPRRSRGAIQVHYSTKLKR